MTNEAHSIAATRNEMKTIADMIALYFAGKVKTQSELRAAIRSLNETTLFDLADADLEIIARDNEARQGVKMF